MCVFVSFVALLRFFLLFFSSPIHHLIMCFVCVYVCGFVFILHMLSLLYYAYHVHFSDIAFAFASIESNITLLDFCFFFVFCFLFVCLFV